LKKKDVKNSDKYVENKNCGFINRVYADREEDFFSDVEVEEKECVNIGLPLIQGKIGNIDVDILIDSGSQVSAISEQFYLKICDDSIPVLPVSNVAIRVAVGNKEQRIQKQIFLPIKIQEHEIDLTLLIIPKLNCSVVLGSDWLCTSKANIDFVKQSVTVQVANKTMVLPLVQNIKGKEPLSLNILKENCEKHRYSEKDLFDASKGAQRLKEREKQALCQLLFEYEDVFSESPGLTNKCEHEIELLDYSP
jgi:Retroviral aspartyl protease